MILYTLIDVKMPVFPKRKVSEWIKQVAASYNKRVGDIAFVFCSDSKILEMNRQYLTHNYFTDVITFDYSVESVLSGDIFISLETVRSNAEKFDVEFCIELYRVMIHGVLHLCGIRDSSSFEKDEMARLEDKALYIFNIKT